MRLTSIPLLLLPLITAHPTTTHQHHHSKEAPLTTSTFDLISSLLGSPFSNAADLISSLTHPHKTIDNYNDAIDDPAEKTIWQLLNEQPDKYSKIVKLIELDGKAKEVLDDRNGEITFFAPGEFACFGSSRGEIARATIGQSPAWRTLQLSSDRSLPLPSKVYSPLFDFIFSQTTRVFLILLSTTMMTMMKKTIWNL